MASITPSTFDARKVSLVTLLQQNNCKDAGFIWNNAQSFPTLRKILYEYGRVFDCNTDYLALLMTVFTDTELIQQLNIYKDKQVAGATVNNPSMIVNSIYDNVNINVIPTYNYLEIVKDSVIKKITISNNITLDTLVIASGSSVDLVEIQPGAGINTVIVKACGGKNGNLKQISGQYQEIAVDEEAHFGGVVCDVMSVLL
jgi:hypothetical protein